MPKQLIRDTCLMTNVEHAARTHGPGTDAHRDATEIPCTCLLRKGHKGPHQWTWDGDAVVSVTSQRDLNVQSPIVTNRD